jgi:DNA-directed RNA polymerase subunit K/omega
MSDIEEIDDISSQNGDVDVESDVVVGSDIGSDIESDIEGSVVDVDDDDDDDASDIDGELSEDDLADEEIQEEKPENSFMDMLGGATAIEETDELEEDIMGENNKKIVHHDDILMLHPESKFHNYDEISAAALVTRNENNIIVDKLHRSVPILTKYEKAKVLGQRTKQLNMGSTPFVAVDRMTMDNSIIAEEELKAKKLPFIIQRPMPGGGVEYWHVKDLEVI